MKYNGFNHSGTFTMSDYLQFTSGIKPFVICGGCRQCTDCLIIPNVEFTLCRECIKSAFLRYDLAQDGGPIV